MMPKTFSLNSSTETRFQQKKLKNYEMSLPLYNNKLQEKVSTKLSVVLWGVNSALAAQMGFLFNLQKTWPSAARLQKRLTENRRASRMSQKKVRKLLKILKLSPKKWHSSSNDHCLFSQMIFIINNFFQIIFIFCFQWFVKSQKALSSNWKKIFHQSKSFSWTCKSVNERIQK